MKARDGILVPAASTIGSPGATNRDEIRIAFVDKNGAPTAELH